MVVINGQNRDPTKRRQALVEMCDCILLIEMTYLHGREADGSPVFNLKENLLECSILPLKTLIARSPGDFFASERKCKALSAELCNQGISLCISNSFPFRLNPKEPSASLTCKLNHLSQCTVINVNENLKHVLQGPCFGTNSQCFVVYEGCRDRI